MSKRYVARVVMPGRRRDVRSRTDRAPVARGVATPRADAAPVPGGPAVIDGPTPDGPAAPSPAAAPPAPGPPPAAPSVPSPAAEAAAGQARGVAAPADPTGGADRTGGADPTQMFQAPDVTAAIFVDRSGRRARALRRVASAVVVLALLLILALWVSQGLDVLGLRVPA